MATEINEYYNIAGQDTLAIAEALGYTKGSVLRHLVRAGHKDGISELEDLKTARSLLDLRISQLEVEEVQAAEAEASKPHGDDHIAAYRGNLKEVIEDSQLFDFPLNLTGALVVLTHNGTLDSGIIAEYVDPMVDPYEPIRVLTIRETSVGEAGVIEHIRPVNMMLIVSKYNAELSERYEIIANDDLADYIEELYRDSGMKGDE